jgi:hypothetical protein
LLEELAAQRSVDEYEYPGDLDVGVPTNVCIGTREFPTSETITGVCQSLSFFVNDISGVVKSGQFYLSEETNFRLS